jgi:hypothetical protein
MDPAYGTEIYSYTNGPNDDGFLKMISDYMQGTMKCDDLDDTGFTSLANRRVPGSENTIMLSRKGFWRKVIVRHPIDGESTPETRQEGLKILKKCFLSPVFTKYPPADIETNDDTDIDNPKPLDMFLQDHDIIDILKEQVDEDDLDVTFYSKFTQCAKNAWSTTHYPAYARSIGFP